VRQKAKRQAKQMEARLDACKKEMETLLHEIRVILSKKLVRPFPCPFVSVSLLLDVCSSSKSFKAPSAFVERLWAWGVDNASSPLREQFEKQDLASVLPQAMIQNGLTFQRLQRFRDASIET